MTEEDGDRKRISPNRHVDSPVTSESGEVVTEGVAIEAEDGLNRSQYDIVTEIEVKHPDLVLASSITSNPDVVLEVEGQSVVDSERPTLFFSASGDDLSAFERALVDDPSVTDPTIVDTLRGRRIYRVRIDPDAERLTPACDELDAHVLALKSTSGGWRINMQLPTRDALVAFNRYCRDRDISLNVTRIRNARSTDAGDLVGLSEKQRTILETALVDGYYDVPRGVSQLELAEQLDISKSAISQRLRRATAQLVAGTLSIDRD